MSGFLKCFCKYTVTKLEGSLREKGSNVLLTVSDATMKVSMTESSLCGETDLASLTKDDFFSLKLKTIKILLSGRF